MPLDDIMAVKDAHDRLQLSASLAFKEAIATIDADAVSTAIRSKLSEGQATRDRFVGVLLPGLIAVCDLRRVLDRTRAVLALAPWYPPVPAGVSAAAQGATDTVMDAASLSAVGKVRDESGPVSAAAKPRSTRQQSRKAPTLPRLISNSANQGPEYVRPLQTAATSTYGGPARSQPGAATGRREIGGGDQNRSMRSKPALDQAWQR